MPINPTYPGVYIDELPASVRTITGVPTSVVAFVGTASRGPTDGPRRVSSWAAFEQRYGGLAANSPMSYAVYQFFANGGADAEIVRITGASAAAAKLPLGSGSVTLQTADEGAWGGKLVAKVDYATKDPSDATLYNLTVRDLGTGAEEQFRNVSTNAADPRNLSTLLSASRLVRVDSASTTRPDDSDPPAAGKQWWEDAAAHYATSTAGNDGNAPAQSHYLGSPAAKTGIYQLLKTDIFNLLCLPGAPETVRQTAAELCLARRAMLIADPPAAWNTVENAYTGSASPLVTGDAARNVAVYFPNVTAPDPLQNGALREFPPCGVVAGVTARTDAQRGVWKAPAGTESGLAGVTELAIPMTDAENGQLNPRGVNCLRSFPVIGPVVWGARTQRGADQLADQWKYSSVRRLALYVEETLYRGTQWVVFEPNDEPLWSSVRLSVGSFMDTLYRQGAFQGASPREAYLVKCDRENNPQADIDRGIVNILVGFRPPKPAEFVTIHIQQLAGDQ